VVLLQFSHDGERVATGSKDGSVRVSLRLGLGAWGLGLGPAAISVVFARRSVMPLLDWLAWWK
jgi:hypothetical protein